MNFRHLAISVVLLAMAGLAWAAPDMRAHKQLHGTPGDTARREELVQQHVDTPEQMMHIMQNMQGMHRGTRMGHMMSQGMTMGHDNGPSREL